MKLLKCVLLDVTLEKSPPSFFIFETLRVSPSGSVSFIRTSPVTPVVPSVTVTESSSSTALVLSVAVGSSLSLPISVIVRVAVSVASCSSDKV